jgi:hypothetical protein
LVQQEQQRRASGGMLVSSSSSALIGDQAKSSFTLVKNMVTYHHRLQQVQHAIFLNTRNGSSSNRTSTATTLHAAPPSWNTDQGGRLPWLCRLPPRPLTGYNYGDGTPTFYRNVKDAPLLKPQRLLQDYQKQHSQEALMREVDSNQHGPLSSPPSWRKFGLLTVDCTNADSEHDFLNGMVWAVLTNRTLLWRAKENDACRLLIQSWIPRWDEWSARWNLTNESLADDDRRDGNNDAGVMRILPTTPLPNSKLLPKDVSTKSRRIAHQLLEYGMDFVNGMMHLKVFQESSTPKEDNATTMKMPIFPTAPVESTGNGNIIILEDFDDGYSVSSASTANNDGANASGNHATSSVERLSACLDQVLGELHNGPTMLPCLVVRIGAKHSRLKDHVSDDDNDYEKSLQQMMVKHNCTIVLHQELQRRLSREGALSFLQNVKPFLLPAFSSYDINIRRSMESFQGWIGQRPSYLVEAIEYRRLMQARERFPVDNIPALRTCDLSASSRSTNWRS